MTRTPDGRPTRHGLRRGVRAGAGALALSLLAAGCGGGGDASPTGSGAATASPGTSPSPTDVPLEFTLHEDFFPVPQADAADIPWDEVGPGWFLVEAHQYDDSNWGDRIGQPVPEAVGGLSLVSPDGEWFAARSFAGTGAAFSLHWAADGVWLKTGGVEEIEAAIGDLVRVDLATGEPTSIATSQTVHFAYASAAGGVTVAQGFSQEVGGPAVVYGAAGVSSPGCDLVLGTFRGDLRSFLSPDGRTVACWRGREDLKTDVGIVDVGAPSAATYLDVFRLDMWHYEQMGWLSDDTFLLARLNDEGAVEAYFAYNVGSRTIEDFALPFTPGAGQKLQAFDYEAQVYVSYSWESDSIDLHRANGEKVGTVAGVCADGSEPRWTLSGTSLLAFCPWEAGAVTLVDLKTGEVVGQWANGAGLAVSVYGYPAHAG